MIISVTKCHFNRGLRGQVKQCALALAFNEQTGITGWCVVPNRRVAYIDYSLDKRVNKDVPLPVEVCYIIQNWDFGNPNVKPFEVDLPIEQHLKELLNANQSY